MANNMGKYSQVCFVDPDLSESFPILSQYYDDGGGMDSELIELYRCICPTQDFQDARTTQAYCPLGYVCGVPELDGDSALPVQCIYNDNSTWDSVIQMACPVLLISLLCLAFWLTMTMYGLALYRFMAKISLLGPRICSSRSTNDDDDEGSDPSGSATILELKERAEAQTLLDWLAESTSNSQSWWNSTSHRPFDRSHAPSRWWYVLQHRDYKYRTTILDRARQRWRKELRLLRKERPLSLSLPIQVFYPDDGHHCERQLNGKDDDSVPTCSICLIEILQGDQVGKIQCRHVFHAGCLKVWLGTGKNPNRCPLCQAPNIATIHTPYATQQDSI